MQEQDQREHEAEILAEVAELQTEVAEDYERKMVEYRTNLEEWRSWRRKQVPESMTGVNQTVTSIYSFISKTVLMIAFRKLSRRSRRRKDSSLTVRKKMRRMSTARKS